MNKTLKLITISLLFICIFSVSIFAEPAGEGETASLSPENFDPKYQIAPAADPNWPKQPDVFAETAILMDASTGTVLYDKASKKRMYPASITKIMTALLALENCKLDETVTVSKEAISILSWDDSHYGCVPGEQFSLKDALYIMMLKSANEMSYAIGEHIAGTNDKFAQMMTQRAKELGAVDTNFVNPNGLHDEKHYVTAYDMALITREACKYKEFEEIVHTAVYNVSPTNARNKPDPVYQRHKMVVPWSSLQDERVIGGKTGYTDQSRTTLVTVAKVGDMKLIAVVLRSDGSHVYQDTKTLIDYGFNNFKINKVSKLDNRIKNDSFDGKKLDLPSDLDTDDMSDFRFDQNSCIIIPNNKDLHNISYEISYKKSDINNVLYYNEKVNTTKTIDSEDASIAPIASVSYSMSGRNVGSAVILASKAVEEETTEILTTASQVTQAVTTKSNKNNPFVDFFTATWPYCLLIIPAVAIIILIIVFKRHLNKARRAKMHRRD